MHVLIASPFLDDFLIVRPGSSSGIKVPASQYADLERTNRAGEPAPAWLLRSAAQRWNLRIPPNSASRDYILVRQRANPQYSRASWEINLGCNYDCEHCYLGLKQFEGLNWSDK